MYNKQEIVELLKDDSCNQYLFDLANKVRQENVGDEVHLRGLIEFSNYCKNDCLYCGLRKSNKLVDRYRIDTPTIIELANHAKNMGLKTIVLQSGEDTHFTKDRMVEVIKGIKDLGIALTLSIGEKSFEEYQAYKEAGADRFLLRIETTDKKLYLDNDPGMNWEERVNCLKNLYKLGYEVGSGCLVGLPNQSIESLADDILFFQEIGAHMIGIGPFIANPSTPLKNAANGNLELALKVMAITRIQMPDINIPATTAMEVLAPDGQVRALNSGANVLMPNITLKDYRKNYQLYPGKTTINATPDESLDKIIKKIESLNRKVGLTEGISKRWQKENEQ